jgi:peroxiredoxin Q/BCP
VLAISTDFIATLAHWSKELGAEFPLVSDHDRKLSELYSVLIPQMGVANRTTFVVDKEGKIAMLEEGSAALDPTGADAACSRLQHRTGQ